jgi:hypothetical protein
LQDAMESKHGSLLVQRMIKREQVRIPYRMFAIGA